MDDRIQTISSPSGDVLVVMPREVYEEIIDARAAREARGALDRGEEELLIEEEVRTLLASPTPFAFWRRKRGLRQVSFAEALGTSQGYASDIESGRRKGSIAFYRGAARLLRVPLETIMPDGDESPGRSPDDDAPPAASA